MSSKINVSIILTHSAQVESGCKGPDFIDVEDYGIEPEGIYVTTKDKNSPMYFYPMSQVARVKRTIIEQE